MQWSWHSVLSTARPPPRRRSPQKLALAAKLQAKLSQHMDALSAAELELPQLQQLHYMQCMETAVRQGDGAALLQCLSRLQPHAAGLLAPQRATMLGMVGSQHSGVVQEAAAALLLDSVAAEGSLEALAFMPAVLSQLALPGAMRLKVASTCRHLLVAMPPPDRSPSWMACCQVFLGCTCWC